MQWQVRAVTQKEAEVYWTVMSVFPLIRQVRAPSQQLAMKVWHVSCLSPLGRDICYVNHHCRLLMGCKKFYGIVYKGVRVLNWHSFLSRACEVPLKSNRNVPPLQFDSLVIIGAIFVRIAFILSPLVQWWAQKNTEITVEKSYWQ